MLLSLIHSLLLLPITQIIPLLDNLQDLLDKLNSVNRVFMRYDKVNSSKSLHSSIMLAIGINFYNSLLSHVLSSMRISTARCCCLFSMGVFFLGNH